MVELNSEMKSRGILPAGFFMGFRKVMLIGSSFNSAAKGCLARQSAVMLLTFIVGLSVLWADMAYAQESAPKNVISFDVANGFRGFGQMEYQRLRSSEFAWTVRGLFYDVELDDSWAVKATGLGFGFRKYTQSSAPEGGFMAAAIDIAQVQANTVVPLGSDPIDLQEAIFIIPNGSVGYSWFIEYITLEVSLGGQYFYGEILPRYVGDVFPMNGMAFYFTLSVGIPF